MEDVGIFYDIWSTLYIFYDHLVYFVVIRYIFSRLGILYQERPGIPAQRVTPPPLPIFSTKLIHEFDRRRS
jgi:hypothetical protein